MTVTRIEAIEVRLPFLRPLATVEGTHTHRHSVLVGLHDEDETGWGEAPAMPSGRFGTADEAWRAVTAGVFDAPGIASAAHQAAMADLEARHRGLPLHRFLGGSEGPVGVRVAVGISRDLDRLTENVGMLVDRGVTAIKLKVAPGADVGPLTVLGAEFPDIDVSVDANGSYRDADDPSLRELDRLGVTLVEQPFAVDDLASHARLRDRVEMAVCLDEGVQSIETAIEAMATGAADVLSVKVLRHGLADFTKILRTARDTGVGIQVGGTFDTSIGRRFLLACATLPGVTRAEVAPPDTYLEADLADYPPLVDGTVRPDGIGLGTTPDPELLDAVVVRRTEIEA